MISHNSSAFLDSRARFGWKLGLEKIESILENLTNPQRSFQAVHIAGSNGKGSTAHMLEAVFTRAGYRVGTFTSPHLISPVERIRIGGKPIKSAEFDEALAAIQPLLEQTDATYFESFTALAFALFRDWKVEIAIVEVGLGGRLDATNVLRPLCSVITTISLEHTQHLGTTLRQIAAEKGGIIKNRVPCVIGRMPDVARAELAKISLKQQAELIDAHRRYPVMDIREGERLEFKLHHPERGEIRLQLSLSGRQQIENAKLALAVTEVLRTTHPVTDNSFRDSLRSVHIAGRMQKLTWHKRLFLIDIAHNVQSIEQLVKTIALKWKKPKIEIVLGLLSDKSASEIVKTLAGICTKIYCMAPDSARAIAASDLKSICESHGLEAIEVNDFEALDKVITNAVNPDEITLVTGSHFLVGGLLQFISQGDPGEHSVHQQHG